MDAYGYDEIIPVVAHLLASADIAGALDLALLILGHVLVVTTERGDDGVAAVMVVVVGFAHDGLLPARLIRRPGEVGDSKLGK